MSTIKPKDRDTLIQALRAGVVPRSGQHLIQVGRVREVEGMLKDIERVDSGGSAFRIVVGEYGAGKTFFLNLVRSIALQKKLVTMHADLNPDRRLHASGGQARSLYAELTKNTSTMLKPEGGALTGVVEKFVAQCKSEAKASGGDTEKVVREKLAPLTELVNGFDFAEVLVAYYRGFEQGNDQHKLERGCGLLRSPLVSAGCAASSPPAPTRATPWECAPSWMTAPSTTSSSCWPSLCVWPATTDCWSVWTNASTSTSWPTPRRAIPTTSRFCAFSTTRCRARPMAWASCWAARPSSSWTRAAASTATPPCSRAWPRIPLPRMGCWICRARCCA